MSLFDFDYLKEAVDRMLGLSLVIAAGTVFFLLALYVISSQFRLFVRKSVAWWLKHLPLAKGSLFQSYLLNASTWIDPPAKWDEKPAPSPYKDGLPFTPTPSPQEVIASAQLHRIAKNRCYQTYGGTTSNDEAVILKTATTNRGNQLLRWEENCLRQIQKSGVSPSESAFFPKLIAAGDRGNKRFNLLQGAQPAEMTGQQLRHHFPDGLEPQQIGWIFHQLLSGLAISHGCNLIHGAIFPQHLIISLSNQSVMLTDWTHTKRRGERFCHIPSRSRHFYPIEGARRLQAVFGTDIFMAAKCMVYLAGGDLHTDEFPQHLPKRMIRFFRACLLDSPAMRPGNASELVEEFGCLLEDLYGRPASPILS